MRFTKKIEDFENQEECIKAIIEFINAMCEVDYELEEAIIKIQKWNDYVENRISKLEKRK